VKNRSRLMISFGDCQISCRSVVLSSVLTAAVTCALHTYIRYFIHQRGVPETHRLALIDPRTNDNKKLCI